MLSALTFLPLVGAIVIVALPGRSVQLLRMVALAVTVAVAAMGVSLFIGFDGTRAAAQNVLETAWFTLPFGASGAREVDVHFFLGVDGVSILLVALTSILMPLVVMSSIGHINHRVKEFLVWLLVMETGMLGVFLSLDVVLFYFFWEVSLVPLYFIVGIWGGDRRLYATIKFFLYTVAGSLVMLVAVIGAIYYLGTSSIPALVESASDLPAETQAWLFGAFALAFAIKVPILPFHTWLADAHTEAPTAGSVLLAAVLLKMGTYGLLRFGVEMFPEAALTYAPVFLALGAIGIVYGAFLAWAQTDLKRLIACSSVSHLGFCVLGLFAMTEAGLRGSVLQMINHGLSTGLLFLLVGMIYERTHTRRLDRFGGIATVMPVFSFFFVFTVLSSAGLPGLNGFVGEYMILAGTFTVSPFWTAISVSGVIFGAVYLLMATRRVLFGPLVHEENRKLLDLGGRELATLIPLVALCVWIGVAPNGFIQKTAGSLDRISHRVERAQEHMRIGRLSTAQQTVLRTEVER
ncbi:MAG: Fe-S-binding domain-containing protein [Planctomycetes bacterium]|jgi:NADH-quinone oxidoreductase subunit M|nr:Fe-S-binding domain-containing protein [Planctomycetota bacterium]